MRALISFWVFLVAYLAWVIYHLMVKRDLKKHTTDFYALTFLIVVWLLIYHFLFG